MPPTISCVYLLCLCICVRKFNKKIGPLSIVLQKRSDKSKRVQMMKRVCLVDEDHQHEKMMSKNGTEKDDKLERPPDDDCCPICFGHFTFPCKTSCGHWFCAGCILEFWHYRAAPQRCKCPICCRLISKLVLESPFLVQNDAEVVGFHKSVQEYNNLYAGCFRGLLMKVRASPLLTRRVFQNLIDPSRLKQNYYILRFFALLLACLYHICECGFIPAGSLGVRRLFDICAICLVCICYLIGLCREKILRHHARRWSALQQQ